MRNNFLSEQRKISAILLKALSNEGFALAGSGAIREHHLIDRPTEDIDLFTVQQYAKTFEKAVGIALEALESNGFVSQVKVNGNFARIVIKLDDTINLTVDMGIDFRSQKPDLLEIGHVLSFEDAVGSKVAALYSRGEDRDFLDVDAIRQSGKISDKELIGLAKNMDTGFDLEYFAERLKEVENISPESVAKYGVTKTQLTQMKQRYNTWCNQIFKNMNYAPSDRRDIREILAQKIQRKKIEYQAEQGFKEIPSEIHPKR